MTSPKPEIGLVIRYAYLWRDEARGGREEGRKDRPCAVVITLQRAVDATTVYVAPITHSPPRDANDAIEIAPAVRRRLGLDDERSWIATGEVNASVWPGPDVRSAQTRYPSRGIAYGHLPRALARKVVEAVLRNARSETLRVVNRDLPSN